MYLYHVSKMGLILKGILLLILVRAAFSSYMLIIIFFAKYGLAYLQFKVWKEKFGRYVCLLCFQS